MAFIKSDKARVDKKKWAIYAAAGGAAMCSGTQTAEADITHVVVGAPDGDWNADDNIYFALEGSAALNFFHPGGRAALQVFNGSGSVAALQYGSFVYLSNLASGANISTLGFVGGFADLASYYGYSNSQFVDTSGIAGFRFDIGNGTQFGWVRVTAAGDAPVNSFVIEEYAFGDAGEAIVAGQITAVPEPTSLGLLAFGAIGVMASRRRKKNEV